MLIRAATVDDAAAIAAIYNAGIAERNATFETAPRDADAILPWIADAPRLPLLVATEANGRLIGWAAVSRYRARACYAGVGEFSIYLAPAARGRGVGRALLQALIDAASEQGYWKLLSRIFPDNRASLALCRACGFREVGVYRRHAQLDGRWRDVVIVERLIADDPPVDAPLAAGESE